MANMVDVSSNNHPGGEPIPWGKLPEVGIRAAMAKATEGTTYINPWLAKDSHGAGAAGLLLGFYHFAHPGRNSPKAEVDAFAGAVEGLSHEIGLALDLELQEGLEATALADWAQQFLALLAEHAAWTVLYSNPDFLRLMPGSPFGHRLWIADYGARPRRECWAWQYAASGQPVALRGMDVSLLYELPAPRIQEAPAP